MAAGDITYGIQAPLADITRLDNLLNGEARVFGKIALAGEIGQSIELNVPISPSATSGTYSVFLVESQNDTTWTDDIVPTNTGNVAAKIADAIFLQNVDTTYNATDRANVKVLIDIDCLRTGKFLALVLLNQSGQTIPAGAAGNSMSKKIS